MTSQISKIRDLLHHSISDQESVETKILEQKALMAFLEVDDNTRLIKRNEVLREGFPAEEWIYWAFEQKDLSYLKHWPDGYCIGKGDVQNTPIDWYMSVGQTYSLGYTHTLIGQILKTDQLDWFDFALNHGLLNQTPKDGSPDAVDMCFSRHITRKPTSKKCQIRILANVSDFSPKQISQACLNFGWKFDEISGKTPQKDWSPLHPFLKKILLDHLDVSQETTPFPGFFSFQRQKTEEEDEEDIHNPLTHLDSQSLAESSFLKAWFKSANACMRYEAQKSGYSNIHLKEDPDLHPFFKKIDAQTLSECFGEGGAWSWALKEGIAQSMDPQIVDSLLSYFDGVLQKAGYPVQATAPLDVLIERLSSLSKRENLPTSEGLKEGLWDTYLSLENYGPTVKSSDLMGWQDWKELLSQAFEYCQKYEGLFDHLFLISQDWEQFLTEETALHWKSCQEIINLDLKQSYDRCRPSWLSQQSPCNLSDVENERMKMALATLPDVGHLPISKKSGPRI